MQFVTMQNALGKSISDADNARFDSEFLSKIVHLKKLIPILFHNDGLRWIEIVTLPNSKAASRESEIDHWTENGMCCKIEMKSYEFWTEMRGVHGFRTAIDQFTSVVPKERN
jgi:hypothetical protein